MKRYILTLSICMMANSISHAQNNEDSLLSRKFGQQWSRPVYEIPAGIRINERMGQYGKNDTCVYFIDIQDISGTGLSPLRIYYHQLDKVDPASFVAATRRHSDTSATAKGLTVADLPSYGKDKNHVYSEHRLIEGANPASFEILGCGYSKDASSIYWYAGKIDHADLETFTVVERPGLPYTHAFAYDKNCLYFLESKVEIDYETFEVNHDEKIYRDKNYTYTFEGKIIKTKRKKS